MKFNRLFAAALFGIFSTSALADRVVTDQLDRQVTIPDHIQRAVVLQHQTLNIAVQLNATKQIVGVLSNWKKQLGQNYVRLAPELEKMAMPGDLNSVNIESLLELKPDVVFVTNYAPPEMVKQIADTGIPVIAISLRTGSDKDKLNPTLADEDKAYNEGLTQGIELIAKVFEKEQQGKELVKAAFANRKMLADRLGDIPAEKRVRTYMANPDLNTYGSGKYTGLMLEHAGAYNVAAATVKGFKQVSMENVLEWNPAVILVQDRYPKVVSQIKEDAAWANIDAVKNNQVFLMPEYAKSLYPQKFQDIDLDKMVNDYYLKFYRQPYNNGK